jgi:hypothetical protein
MQRLTNECKKYMKVVYEMHRSEAITVLLKVLKHPQLFNNIELAEMLEDVNNSRIYIVKEDHLELGNKSLTAKTF